MPQVLIVDDEAPVRDVIERWLTAAGYEARKAESADAALEQMKVSPAEVVLCDVCMPGRDGLWLTEQLRARYPSTAVVLATGLAEIPGSTALREGVVGYVLKPFQPGALLKAIGDGVKFNRAMTTQAMTTPGSVTWSSE